MNITIVSNYDFAVSSIHYSPNGELQIRLEKEGEPSENRYEYAVCLGDGKSEKRPTYSLLEYAQRFARDSSIKDKTKDSYRPMSKQPEKYGDCTIDNITTNYLQGFIAYLQEQGLKVGSVRLYYTGFVVGLYCIHTRDDGINKLTKRVKNQINGTTCVEIDG